ncbi:phosphate starvation protein PhoH [Pandoraea terrae]|uniref:Phosphate starvation protein PhoH n=1 Tax=Pandoraea terrae TaxID=1537710 RepID=A0A5E4WW20_9BURK|nr:PhoH family protein [Pandoraea terrae]VVE27784.1 phosphate starvation protein PhoH [Pandoraea terrae]
MPLPSAPTKPGTLLAPDQFPTRLKPSRTEAKKPIPQAEQTALGEPGGGQSAAAPNRATSNLAAAGNPVVAKAPAANNEHPSARSPRPSPGGESARGGASKPSSGAPQSKGSAARTRGGEPAKLFVLDTNVLMHDPSSLFRFEEHDVYLPMMTLEELDNHKKGMSEVARNARQVSRTLDGLVADSGTTGMADGILLSRLGNKDAAGRLYFQTDLPQTEPLEGLPQGKADNQILGVVRALQKKFADRQVVLVSKDINMRVKAHALGLPAEDYFNDKVLEDSDLLYSGVMALPLDFWTKHGKGMESWQDNRTGTTFYRITGPACANFLINQFVFLETNNGEAPFYAQVREINGKTALLQTLRDYGHHKNNVWGITARNREQNFALNLLMNPEVDFITLLGQAGTGKTLLALAAGLSQTLDEKRYNEIIITRATVPVGEDIGFLPGTEEEKMQPWMGAFDDNLEVLQKTDDSAGDWGRAATQELIRSRLKVKSMNFMRGRTFVNKFVIIDEAQNLTPKQMKTLVTRAGPGTKLICLGNIAQIDTPYLTEGSSGLTYVVDRFKGWGHSGHVTLARGERSRLADYAADIL